MKLVLVVIGKTTEKFIAEGFESYAKRLSRYCQFELKIIPELKNTKSMPIELQLHKEGDMILGEIQNLTRTKKHQIDAH